MKRRVRASHLRQSCKSAGNRKMVYFLIIFAILLILPIITIMHKYAGVKGIKNTPFLSTYSTQLISHGKPYAFTGFNIFNIATLPGHNAGCGSYVSDVNSLFATFRPNSIVRMWAWQGSMGINPTTKSLDFAGIDRVVAAAKKNNIKLIVSLGTQSGQCDDGQWKGSSWYL